MIEYDIELCNFLEFVKGAMVVAKRYVITKPEEHLVHRTDSLQMVTQITKRPKWVVEQYINSDKLLDGWKIVDQTEVAS